MRWLARLFGYGDHSGETGPRRDRETNAAIVAAREARARMGTQATTRRREAAQTRLEQMRLRRSIRTGNPLEDTLFPATPRRQRS